MKYCVIKNTSIIIDGSENTEEIMRENALNAGFSEFEILTEEEYKERKVNEEIEPQPPTLQETLLKEVASLKISDMKKDAIITNALKTIAELKLEIMNLKEVK